MGRRASGRPRIADPLGGAAEVHPRRRRARLPVQRPAPFHRGHHRPCRRARPGRGPRPLEFPTSSPTRPSRLGSERSESLPPLARARSPDLVDPIPADGWALAGVPTRPRSARSAAAPSSRALDSLTLAEIAASLRDLGRAGMDFVAVASRPGRWNALSATSAVPPTVDRSSPMGSRPERATPSLYDDARLIPPRKPRVGSTRSVFATHRPTRAAGSLSRRCCRRNPRGSPGRH
jgi:hypothetical protein